MSIPSYLVGMTPRELQEWIETPFTENGLNNRLGQCITDYLIVLYLLRKNHNGKRMKGNNI